MTHKLDAAVAEALGREVTWQRKVRTGGRRTKLAYVYYACSPDDKFAQLFYAGTDAEVPKFHKDGNAMLELDVVMRGLGWILLVFYAGVYCANYHNEKDVEIEFPAEANTMPKAVARAAYYVLTGKEWGG